MLWRNTRGDEVEPFSGADASGNGIVGDEDYHIWRSHFGNTDTLLQIDGNGAENLASPTAEAVATGDDVSYASTGEAASATRRNPRIRSDVLPTPRTVDAALLVLLAEHDTRQGRSDDSPTTLNHTSLATDDELFAELAVDVRLRV